MLKFFRKVLCMILAVVMIAGIAPRVEAQAAGLPVLMSDVITPEVYIVPHLHTKSLSSSAEEWADEALSLIQSYKRRDCINEIRSAGFDIQETADWLQSFYIERTLKARRAEK